MAGGGGGEGAFSRPPDAGPGGAHCAARPHRTGWMSSPGRKVLISVSHGISHSPGTALREKKHISPLLILHKNESFREYSFSR